MEKLIIWIERNWLIGPKERRLHALWIALKIWQVLEPKDLDSTWFKQIDITIHYMTGHYSIYRSLNIYYIQYLNQARGCTMLPPQALGGLSALRPHVVRVPGLNGQPGGKVVADVAVCPIAETHHLSSEAWGVSEKTFPWNSWSRAWPCIQRSWDAFLGQLNGEHQIFRFCGVLWDVLCQLSQSSLLSFILSDGRA